MCYLHGLNPVLIVLYLCSEDLLQLPLFPEKGSDNKEREKY